MSYKKYNLRTGITKLKTKTFIALSILGLAGGGASLSLAAFGAAHAATPYSLTPWTYVGAAGDCGTGAPAGTAGGVVSQWDTSTGNPAPSLRLEKNVPTTDCSSAGATVNGVSGITLTELNFDYNGYCGAGAPRFNVVTSDNVTHFLGCSAGTASDLGNGWTHVVFDPTNPAQAFPVITPGTTVTSIDLVMDEQGQVNIDNVSVNGQTLADVNILASKDQCKNGGWQTGNFQDVNGNALTFRNQGLCVAYVNHHDANGQDGLHAHNL